MSNEPERRRVLVAARATEEPALRELFTADVLGGWEAIPADSFERARFVLQHTPCDLLMVDEGLCCAAADEGLAWLARQRDVPVVFLAGNEAETCALAYERGATMCLPRQPTLAYPRLLAAALCRAAQLTDAQRQHRRTREGLMQSRRQIDRLVSLLWRTTPTDPQWHWCTQRHVLERLEEELARVGRHGGDLTVALGEVETPELNNGDGEIASAWLPERLGRVMRRCDVAGQYGLRGFLLLMVETTKEGGIRCCERLQQALEQDSATGPSGPVRVAFGLESLSAETNTPQSLLSRAERHLEAARAGMSGRVVAQE